MIRSVFYRLTAKTALLCCLILTACKSVPHDTVASGPERQAPAVEKFAYAADTAASYIRWTGSRPGKKHYGTLHLQNGGLTVNKDRITGGRFEIALESLTPQDQHRKGNELLRKHLLGEDFFEAGKYPVILFEIVSVEKQNASTQVYTVTGNLKLRDVVKSVSFPAAINMKDSMLTADAGFSFDRTQWGLNYGNDKSLGNWFIRPAVAIKLHLAAKKV